MIVAKYQLPTPATQQYLNKFLSFLVAEHFALHEGVRLRQDLIGPWEVVSRKCIRTELVTECQFWMRMRVLTRPVLFFTMLICLIDPSLVGLVYYVP